MHSISIQDNDKLLSLMMEETYKNINKTSYTQEDFLHDIGYKSATWIEGTSRFALSPRDYTMFILRWPPLTTNNNYA